jgi:putative tryptophan/tyrosine transport system substrate-binding protein
MKNQRVPGNRSGLAARRCDGRDGGQAADGCDDGRALAGFLTRGGGFGGLFAAGVCGDLDIGAISSSPFPQDRLFGKAGPTEYRPWVMGARVRRRDVIAFLGGAATAWPLAASVQQASAVRKIGFLYPGPSTAAPARIDAFSEGLRAAGYRVPEQVEIISRFAESDPTRLATLARELIERNVDVIAAVSAGAANAVRAATTTVPIVALDLETDPVATGMIKSLAHPGANLTGFFFDFPEFRTKLLELLKEVVPNLSKIAVVWDPNSGPAQLASVEAGAAAMKLKLEEFEARNVAEMSEAFDAAKRADVDAVMVPSSAFLAANTKLMADLASSHALPAVTLSSEFARNGGLMSYGPNTLDIYRHLGGLAAKVLQGRQPSELPVELPTKFELVLNLKTARALKLEIPATLLIRADEVIE